MIERDSIMSTTKDHSNISPMFHPAESWHAENVNQFFAAVVSSVILLVCGISLRSTEYSLIKNQAEQRWYEHSIFFTFFHNFVHNGFYKDPANMLLSLWGLILGVALVTAFLETKTVESSNTASAFYLFVCLLSCAIVIITGYIAPDMFKQYDFGLSSLLTIISVCIAAFALSYGVKQVISSRAMQKNEMLRSNHLNEYRSLTKRSSVRRLPRTDTILRPIFGLTLMTTLATFIACGIAALFGRMSNHLVVRIITLVIAVVLELIPCSFDRFFMLQIGVYGQPNEENQTQYKCPKLKYHFPTAVLSWIISILPFSLVLSPTTTLMFVFTILIPILIYIFYLIPFWNRFLVPIDKWLIKRFIKDDQKYIDIDHFRLSTNVASTYLRSELSVDTHRQHLLHTTLAPTENGEWAKICYPASCDTKRVPLLSLSIDELQKILESYDSQRNNIVELDATKHQRNITCLVDQIATNDRKFDCCNQEDCKIYLAAIFDDRQYLSTSISPEADKEERLQKAITHRFSSFKGKWQLILTLVKR